MRHLFWIAGLLFLFSACDNDDDPIFVDQPAGDDIRYVIHLSGDWILDYTKYVNDEVEVLTAFVNHDSLVEVISKNNMGQVTMKRTFLMGADGLAVSGTDSVYGSNGLDVYRTTYAYENGFCISQNTEWSGADGSGRIRVERVVENSNITTVYVIEPSGCSDKYQYGNELNRIDLITLNNGITGKWSTNLPHTVQTQVGCPCGPSSSIPFSTFVYELDANGYVTKRVETKTPCYQLHDPGEVVRTVWTERYEYIFN